MTRGDLLFGLICGAFAACVLYAANRMARDTCDSEWNASGYRTRTIGWTCVVEIEPGRWIPSANVRVPPCP